MKRFALIAALACRLSASQPTEAELTRYLADAKVEWRMLDLPVEIRMEPLGPCPVATTPRDKTVPNVAITEVRKAQATLTFDGGAAVNLVPSYSYVIRVNSNCDWSLIPLDRVIAHEYGHCEVGPDYHSRDKRSVMYPVAHRGSKVMEADRK